MSIGFVNALSAANKLRQTLEARYTTCVSGDEGDGSVKIELAQKIEGAKFVKVIMSVRLDSKERSVFIYPETGYKFASSCSSFYSSYLIDRNIERFNAVFRSCLGELRKSTGHSFRVEPMSYFPLQAQSNRN